MASFLLLLPAFLLRQESRSGSILNTRSLVLSGLRRHPGRTLPVIILFATGVFLVMAIGSNRKIAPGTAGEQEHSDGTGGFGYFIETTVPVSGSLNDPGVRATYGLEVPARFVQMKRLPGDDASCLNLNRVSRPPLLSVGRGILDGRFRFQELSDPDFRDRPWDLLEEPAGEGIIRAFADGNVIRWGLGLKVGDTLRYAAENGDSIRVVLSGALADVPAGPSPMVSGRP